jgi:hypothetical protein
MATAVFSLPQRVEEEGLLPFVEQLIVCDGAEEIVLDAAAAWAHTAGALVALAAMQRRWERQPIAAGTEAKKVKLVSFERWPMHQCFKGSSVARGALGEGIILGLTSPICEVGPQEGEVERVASTLAMAVAPDGWAGGPQYPLVQYCFGELLRNCVQHAGEPSFAVVQEHCDAFGDVTFLRLAVVDCGRGVRLSFLENQSPKASPGTSDAEALVRAIEPRVSCTVHLPRLPYGHSSNMGVGLSMVRQLARDTGGHFTIFSGLGLLHQAGDTSQVHEIGPAAWPGCIVSMSLGVEAMTTYADMLAAARAALGLTTRRNVDKLFE